MTDTLIMDEIAIGRALARITHEIIERNQGVENICLLGVKRRGVPLAERLGENIRRFEGADVPVGSIDITKHRDDRAVPDLAVGLEACRIPCDITGKTVIIVDDVLFTGRTARAAMEAVFTYGRPQKVQLAVLVDRGHRELPIRADYVCKNAPTSLAERVFVHLDEFDGETAVHIIRID